MNLDRTIRPPRIHGMQENKSSDNQQRGGKRIEKQVSTRPPSFSRCQAGMTQTIATNPSAQRTRYSAQGCVNNQATLRQENQSLSKVSDSALRRNSNTFAEESLAVRQLQPQYITQICNQKSPGNSGSSVTIHCTSSQLGLYLQSIWVVLGIRLSHPPIPSAIVDVFSGKLVDLQLFANQSEADTAFNSTHSGPPDTTTFIQNLNDEAKQRPQSEPSPQPQHPQHQDLIDASAWRDQLAVLTACDAQLDATIPDVPQVRHVRPHSAPPNPLSSQLKPQLKSGRWRLTTLSTPLDSPESQDIPLVSTSNEIQVGEDMFHVNQTAFIELWHRFATRAESWIRKQVNRKCSPANTITVKNLEIAVCPSLKSFWQSLQKLESRTESHKSLPSQLSKDVLGRTQLPPNPANLLSPAEQAVLFAPLNSSFLEVHTPLPPQHSRFRGVSAFRTPHSQQCSTYSANLNESLRDVLAARLIKPDAAKSLVRPHNVGRAPSVLHETYYKDVKGKRPNTPPLRPTVHGAVNTYLASAQDTAMRCRRAMLLAAAVEETDRDLEEVRRRILQQRQQNLVSAAENTQHNQMQNRQSSKPQQTRKNSAPTPLPLTTDGRLDENPGGMGLFWKYPGNL